MPTSTPTPSLQVTLDAVGDLMLGRTVGDQMLAQGPGIVFAGVQSALDSADVRIGNLECALTDRSTSEHKKYPLQAPPEAAQALSLGKFDVVSLANNHAMDYGYQGLTDSQNYLNQYGVATVGAGANSTAAHTPVILERNGLRLAFLAYVDVPVEMDGFDAHDWIATASKPGIAWADPGQIKADVNAARRVADVVIVFLHSGWENRTLISPDQRTEAHAAIDAGASLVIGAHSHMLQQTEMYHGGLIAYSLGNFVFDDYKGDSNQTVVLRVVLVRNGVQSYDYIPALIENGLPHLVTYDQFPGIGTMVAPLTP
jgi:poly-gamma-glutamate synthesis protein (capsule biosynthesis protein)